MAYDTLTCPACSSTNVKAKRSLLGRALGGFLAPKSQIKCSDCGQTNKRVK